MPKENNETVSPLRAKFAQTLAATGNLEKQVNTVYQKFTKVALAPELAKCLSPESTDSEKHLQRIALIRSSLGVKPSIVEQPILTIPKFKKACAEHDLDIIGHALNLQNQKLALYEMLHPLASALKLETEAQLIEQSITDNRNTNTWLRQILQNIVSPSLSEGH